MRNLKGKRAEVWEVVERWGDQDGAREKIEKTI